MLGMSSMNFGIWNLLGIQSSLVWLGSAHPQKKKIC